MGIESRHAYRFGFLKSEEWQNLRLELLVKIGTECQLCGHDDLSNDLHHTKYPKRWMETKSKHVIVLCRRCHTWLHSVFENSKFPQMDSYKFNLIVRELRRKGVREFTPEDFGNQIATTKTDKFSRTKRFTYFLKVAQKKIRKFLLTSNSHESSGAAVVR